MDTKKCTGAREAKRAHSVTASCHHNGELAVLATRRLSYGTCHAIICVFYGVVLVLSLSA
jgi:hypothetical protein